MRRARSKHSLHIPGFAEKVGQQVNYTFGMLSGVGPLTSFFVFIILIVYSGEWLFWSVRRRIIVVTRFYKNSLESKNATARGYSM
jgi:hypothetical protein